MTINDNKNIIFTSKNYAPFVPKKMLLTRIKKSIGLLEKRNKYSKLKVQAINNTFDAVFDCIYIHILRDYRKIHKTISSVFHLAKIHIKSRLNNHKSFEIWILNADKSSNRETSLQLAIPIDILVKAHIRINFENTQVSKEFIEEIIKQTLDDQQEDLNIKFWKICQEDLPMFCHSRLKNPLLLSKFIYNQNKGKKLAFFDINHLFMKEISSENL